MRIREGKFRKFLETVVNILLVVGCLGLIAVVIKNYFIPSAAIIKPVAVGDEISFPGSAWTKGQKTLLLFLQSDCQYCTNSKSFYDDIARETAGNSGAKIIAVFSEKDNSFEKYLKKLGLPNLETRQANFSRIGIEGTPTITLIDENGVVESVWKGMLSPKKQTDVKRELGLQTTDWFIEESELSDLKKKEGAVTVIDIRDREAYARKHFAEAINIPRDELFVRGINEVSPTEAIVVYGTFENESEEAQEVLAKEGFRKIYILNYNFQ